MNAFDNWLKSMADNSKTCDNVITESYKKIKRHRLGKLSEDEQGMIKYRRLLDKWITKEEYDDYVYTDDDGNETDRDPGGVEYYLKGFYNLIISNTDYVITLDNKAISPKDLMDNGSKNLYNVFTSDDVWYKNIECKLNSCSYSIGKLIYQILREDDESESGINKSGEFLEELFGIMIEYDVGKIENSSRNIVLKLLMINLEQ